MENTTHVPVGPCGNDVAYDTMTVIKAMIVLCALCYSAYRLVTRMVKGFFAYWIRWHDVPMAASHDYYFTSRILMACDATAYAIFRLFTGIDLDLIRPQGDTFPAYYEFADSSPLCLDQMVTYCEFIWNPLNDQNTTTECFHALVYYKGNIYQSYVTRRWNFWSAIDAYPLVCIALPASVRELFEERCVRLTPAIFNQYCAPRSHPIPVDAPLRCCKCYRAYLDPARDKLTLPVRVVKSTDENSACK